MRSGASFRRGIAVGVSGACLAGAALSVWAELGEAVWTATGFSGPESVVYDEEREVFYVSNVNGGALEKDGNGFVSKVGPDGKIVELRWVTGLDAPKGMALVGNKLYVADIDRLVVIDAIKGEILEKLVAEDAEFLNDVAASPDGEIFVSDLLATRILHLADGKLEEWLRSEELEYPNGLLAEKERVVVASWGRPDASFNTETPGHMKVVTLSERKVRSLGDGKPLGNLDGVEPDGSGGYFVTDWIAGTLYQIDEKGEAQVMLDLAAGSADLEFVPSKKLLIIPQMLEGNLVAYPVK